MPTPSRATARVAQLQIQKGKTRSTVTAYVPSNIRGPEFAKLNAVLVDKVIKDLTGCPCLSGAVDVIFHDDLASSISVDLASGKLG
jgi:hypothetical protein